MTSNSPEEEWRPVPGFEHLYHVSNIGRVKSITRYKKEKSQKNVFGYKRVNLRLPGKSNNMGVHRLVALAFIPNPESKPYINHIDGDKANNHVSNLEWCTPAENMKHASLIGAMPVGSKNASAKLKEADVLAIRANKEGLSSKQMALKYGVTENTIWYVRSRRTWKHLTEVAS